MRAAEHLVAFFERSPQPASHPVWETRQEIREGFRCQPEVPAEAREDPD